MLLRSGARWERTKEDGAPPAAPILDSADSPSTGTPWSGASPDKGLPGSAVAAFNRENGGGAQPYFRVRERETWVGRGGKAGGRRNTGSSVAGVGRLLAAEIGRRGRARAFPFCACGTRNIGNSRGAFGKQSERNLFLT
jgi:hypothetical protein